jgi:hypothetical protein
MTVPTLGEVAAEARCLDGKAPLIVGGWSADDGGLGDEASTNLADDSIEGDAGEGAKVLQDVPRPGVGTHFLDHLFRQVLATVVAVNILSVDELAAGYAGRGVTMPDALSDWAERSEAHACGDFEGVVAGRQLIVRAGAGEAVGGGGFQRLFHAASLQVRQF